MTTTEATWPAHEPAFERLTALAKAYAGARPFTSMTVPADLVAALGTETPDWPAGTGATQLIQETIAAHLNEAPSVVIRQADGSFEVSGGYIVGLRSCVVAAGSVRCARCGRPPHVSDGTCKGWLTSEDLAAPGRAYKVVLQGPTTTPLASDEEDDEDEPS